MGFLTRSRRMRMGTGPGALCTCAFALLLSGCVTAATDTSEPAAGGDLFGTNIVTLAITISPAELDTLRHNSDSHSYIPATVSSGGETLTNVGLHCRGNPASELATGKPD